MDTPVKLAPSTNVAEAAESAAEDDESRSRMYWFIHNIGILLVRFLREHRIASIVLCVLFLGSTFALRAVIHPYVIFLRARVFLVLMGVPFVWLVWAQFVRGGWKRRLVLGGLLVVLIPSIAKWGDEVHNYLSLYRQYQLLEKQELEVMPTTGYERIQPLNAIHSLAYEAMGTTEIPQVPDLMRVGNEYQWTIGVEPAYVVPRVFEGVRKVFSLSATSSAPDFQHERPVSVAFYSGEQLLFSRNSATTTIRTFDFFRFFSYQPEDVVYSTNDSGEWVQIVKLVRWKGLFFPRPEFGGVQVISQEPAHQDALASVRRMLRIMLFGAGEWIPPERISEYPYLVGQNIVPYQVSRYIADSFRFQAGFFGPMPGSHLGDVRITDLEADVNPQPFTVHFNVPEREQLYQYFGLEPVDVDKQGLNTSVLVPADGTLPVLFYRHFDRSEVLLGVSAVSPKIIESKKSYDWNRHRPVEHRPVVKEVGGKRRFFWLTTVITRKDQVEGDKRFIAGAKPETALTDAAYNVVVWVPPDHPDQWKVLLEEQLSKIWR